MTGGKLKTFSFSKLSNVSTLDETFVRDAEIDARLLRDEGIWLAERQFKVRLLVAPDVAGYFKRRRLIANQVVEAERDDGSLVVVSGGRAPEPDPADRALLGASYSGSGACRATVGTR